MFHLNNKNISHVIGLFSIFLIIMQSCGIRYFKGIGISISLLLFALNCKNFLFMNKKEWYFLLFALIILDINYLILDTLPSLNYIILQISIILNVFLVLTFYRQKKFDIVYDLYTNLKFFFLLSLLGYVTYLLIPFWFVKMDFGLIYTSLAGILNVTHNGNLPRATGLFWEPGVMSLFVNLYLFLAFIYGVNWKKMAVISLLVILTFSTTGYIVLLMNYGIFLVIKNKIKFTHILGCILVLVFLYPLVIDNYEHKMDSGSGIIRERDISIGLLIMQRHPLFGTGNLQNLENHVSVEIMQEQERYWGSNYIKSEGYLSGGYTNGLLGIFIKYGIPIGILLYWLLFNNVFGRTKKEQFAFALIWTVSSIGEPIADTSLFLMLAFSGVILKSKSNING